MTAGCQIIHVEIGSTHLEHRPGISENVPGRAMMQKDCYPSRRSSCHRFHAAEVHSLFREPLQSKLAQCVVAETRDESNGNAKSRQIVGQNRRRTAECHAEIIGEQLPFDRHLFRKTVKDQVQIGFARDCDIEAFLHQSPFCSASITVPGAGQISQSAQAGSRPSYCFVSSLYEMKGRIVFAKECGEFTGPLRLGSRPRTRTRW